MRAALLSLLLVSCGLGPTRPDGRDRAPSAPAWTWSGPPVKHAVVIVTDTTRADVLRAARTPRLDALRARGARVERAWSAGTWTVPSTVSLFTGATVRAHGFDLATGKLGRYPPLPDRPMLAEVLRSEGFSTWGAYANPYLAEAMGWDRGFDTWKRTTDPAMPELFAAHVRDQWGDGERHFAYLHLIGPHSPLAPSEAARKRAGVDKAWFDESRGFLIGVAKRDRKGPARKAYAKSYKAVLEDVDARIGQLLDALGEHRKDTLVVVTSDHGELLGEHDRVGHGHHVWEALTWVPLLADHPALEGKEEQLPDAASNAMVADLVTRSLGVAHTWEVSVTNPLPLVAQREGRVALSPEGRLKGVWDADVAPELVAFDLRADPGEEAALSDPGKRQRLTDARAAFEARVPPGPDPRAATVELEEADVKALKELGYLQDDDETE